MKEKKFLLIFLGVIFSIIYLIKKSVAYFNICLVEKMKQINKWNLYYNICLIWLELKDKKVTLANFLKRNNYNRVAIYGYGNLGKILHSELEENGIKVEYIIDQNAVYLKEGVEVKTLNDELSEVDVVIITVVEQADKIKEQIEKISNNKAFSLEEVVFNSYYK